MDVKLFIKELTQLYNNHGAYLWGGSGQVVGKTTIDEIVAQESTSNDPINNVSKVFNRIIEMLKEGWSLDKAQFFDCSGFIIYVLEKLKLFKGDVNADTLYNLGTPIPVSKAKVGDLVFKGTDKKKDHVGAVISTTRVIECKGRAYGITTSDISTWQYACHYTWFDKMTLNRKLKVTTGVTPALMGDDVTNVQKALCSHGFPCKVTGVYTTNTKDAVTKFQKAMGLTVMTYGVVAKKTAVALGFTWKSK